MSAEAAGEIVRVEGLSYTYAGHDRAAVANLDLSLRQGTLTLLAGASGSGKTTLLRALGGLIPRDAAGEMQGRVIVAGLDTRTASARDLAERVGFVMQVASEQFCTSSVEAELAFGMENLAWPAARIGQRIDEALTRFELAEYRHERPERLSGGQQVRLLLAAVWCVGPAVVLLDEPLAQLDGHAAAALASDLRALVAQGATIVVAEHRMQELLPLADRLVVLDEGRISIDGRPNDAHGQLAASGLLTPQSDIAVEVVRRSRTSDSPPPAMVFSAHGLEFRYASRTAPVWSDVDFTVRRGECVAVVGGNGSGKSTLLGVAAGLLRSTRGRVERAGPPPGARDRRKGPPEPAVGFVPQNPGLALLCATVRREIESALFERKTPRDEIRSRVQELAEVFDLVELLEEPPLALSEGQQLRVAVAAAIAARPALLVLDEPTTGQDLAHATQVLQAVAAELGSGDSIGGVLFATHDRSAVARFADRVLVLCGGRLVADATTEVVLADTGLIEQTGLRTEMHLPAASKQGSAVRDPALENAP